MRGVFCRSTLVLDETLVSGRSRCCMSSPQHGSLQIGKLSAQVADVEESKRAALAAAEAKIARCQEEVGFASPSLLLL